MDRNVRIKANIGEDQVLHVNMKQNADLFEILSLTLNQSDAYKLHSSNYGVIVGRILANDAFGVPNAKVSVFVPLDENDTDNVSLKNIYPYESVTDSNSDGVRYNLLPTYSSDPCYTQVGTFPSKRLVLDEDTVLEVYDKYYKYTATTNKAGDYMIFGVPTGATTVHVDVDLSDIGILSQKPRDFTYKGYNINQFDSPTKFKSSTSLASLPQIFSQDETMTVYPFWSDEDAAQAAISRKDINLQYTFESTCVFLGSAICDTGSNSISHNCEPNNNIGEMSQLTTSEGTIEMIRKTPFGNIEEKSIQGNQLISSDGVWCYQIPMNLDYIGMDEYGNIVPTNDPTKGIPTRTSVRFRISLNEAGYEGMTNHKAKYLVPNNPFVYPNADHKPILSGDSKTYYDSFYEFGSKTPDCCFRDLYWNCVYTVKNYIPRIQKNLKALNDAHTGIKGVNKKSVGDKNPFPYNKVNGNLRGSAWTLFQYMWSKIDVRKQFEFLFGKGITHEKAVKYFVAQYIEENDGISLDFFNDWINGSLYFPLWFWRVRKKKKYKKNENVYSSEFCSCTSKLNGKKNKLYNVSTCDLPFEIVDESITFTPKDVTEYTNLDRVTKNSRLPHGIIREVQNKDNLSVYYYSTSDIDNGNFTRLFSTDIVLLGSLTDNDINGIPQIVDRYPATSSHIPPIVSSIFSDYDDDDDSQAGSDESSKNKSNDDDNDNVKTINSYSGETITGMMWGEFDNNQFGLAEAMKALIQIGDASAAAIFKDGLFFGISFRRFGLLFAKALNCLYTMSKSYLNAQRICELGVSMDMRPTNSNLGTFGYNDGLITKHEINDEYIRQMFATLNMNTLIASDKYINHITGYPMYPIRYTSPVNFDGNMSNLTNTLTNGLTTDIESKDYNAFRFGQYGNFKFYVKSSNEYYFPLYDNSYYFYFGLNQGNTAIDKFKSEFYEDCSSNAIMNNELPFTYSFSVPTPSLSDIEGNNGSFTITINNVDVSDFSDVKFDCVLDTTNQTYSFNYDVVSKTYTCTINNLAFTRQNVTINMYVNDNVYATVATSVDLAVNTNLVIQSTISDKVLTISEISFLGQYFTNFTVSNGTITIADADYTLAVDVTNSEGEPSNYTGTEKSITIVDTNPGSYTITISLNGQDIIKPWSTTIEIQ